MLLEKEQILNQCLSSPRHYWESMENKEVYNKIKNKKKNQRGLQKLSTRSGKDWEWNCLIPTMYGGKQRRSSAKPSSVCGLPRERMWKFLNFWKLHNLDFHKCQTGACLYLFFDSLLLCDQKHLTSVSFPTSLFPTLFIGFW